MASAKRIRRATQEVERLERMVEARRGRPAAAKARGVDEWEQLRRIDAVTNAVMKLGLARERLARL